jgi:hypothetical protein
MLRNGIVAFGRATRAVRQAAVPPSHRSPFFFGRVILTRQLERAV